MFIGHFALGFGAKRVAPPLSLGTAFLACQLADLVWPTLVLLRIEVVEIRPGTSVLTGLDFVRYPYSHSLVALLLWGAALALIYWALRRSRPMTAGTAGIAGVVGALVVSHWFLDYLVHRPDLPLTIHGSERYGLGLWNSVPATLGLELPLYAVGVILYARATRARDRRGSLGLWGLVALLPAIYFANLFGPPPPSAGAVAWAGEAMWLLVAWGYWVDRHRQARLAA